eukprot:scaffold1044_cov120-Isochrysis_galbana.AAC.27
MLSAWHWRGAHQHINLKEPPPAEKAASLSSSSSNFLAFSAPREANEASNTKGGENSLPTSSTESPFRTRLSKALQTTLRSCPGLIGKALERGCGTRLLTPPKGVWEGPRAIVHLPRNTRCRFLSPRLLVPSLPRRHVLGKCACVCVCAEGIGSPSPAKEGGLSCGGANNDEHM